MTPVDELEGLGAAAVARVYERWLEEVAAGKPDPLVARRRLARLGTGLLERVVFEGRMRGVMMGFVSGMGDVLGRGVKMDRTDAEQLAKSTIEIETSDVARKPFAKAIESFRQRVPVTRESWDRMTRREQRRAFTVAGLAKADFVGVARDVMDEAIAEGWEREAFVSALEARFVEAGLSPLNPSHAETVFRTNLSTAHAEGRMAAFTQPAVLRARPLWEWSAVIDKTTRESHADMHGLAMAADDPAWATIAPPAGFNCRCSIAPIRADQAGEIVTGGDPRVRALPDEGWSGGGAALGLLELEPEDDDQPREAARAPRPLDGTITAWSSRPIELGFVAMAGEKVVDGELVIAGTTVPFGGHRFRWVPSAPIPPGVVTGEVRATLASGRIVRREIVLRAVEAAC